MFSSDWFSAAGCVIALFALWKSSEANKIATQALQIEKDRLAKEEVDRIPVIELNVTSAEYQVANSNVQIWVKLDVLNLGGKTTLKSAHLDILGEKFDVQNSLGKIKLPCSINTQDTTNLHLYFDANLLNRQFNQQMKDLQPELIIQHSLGIVQQKIMLKKTEPVTIYMR